MDSDNKEKQSPESSPANFTRSLKYGPQILRIAIVYLIHQTGLIKFNIFK